MRDEEDEVKPQPISRLRARARMEHRLGSSKKSRKGLRSDGYSRNLG